MSRKKLLKAIGVVIAVSVIPCILMILWSYIGLFNLLLVIAPIAFISGVYLIYDALNNLKYK